jgi:hypothetical protein
MGGIPKEDSESGEVDPPKPGECEDFPPYCYVDDSPGDQGESDPGSGESGEESGWVEPLPGYWSEEEDLWREDPTDDQGDGEDQSEDEDQGSGEDHGEEADDPDFTVCIYDFAPPTVEKGEGRAEARKERAKARRKAARQRAQARRKAARKRAAAKRQQKKKAKAKKAAKARNS